MILGTVFNTEVMEVDLQSAYDFFFLYFPSIRFMPSSFFFKKKVTSIGCVELRKVTSPRLESIDRSMILTPTHHPHQNGPMRENKRKRFTLQEKKKPYEKTPAPPFKSPWGYLSFHDPPSSHPLLSYTQTTNHRTPSLTLLDTIQISGWYVAQRAGKKTPPNLSTCACRGTFGEFTSRPYMGV